MWQRFTTILRAGVLLVNVSLLLSSPAGALVANGEHAPDIAGQAWINSVPLSMGTLGGRVVLVEFWTYG